MTLPLRKKIKRRRFSARDYADILKRQQFLCACGCGLPLMDPRDVHYDHELPLWAGGKDDPSNLRALLRKHHIEKTRGEAADLAKVRRIAAKNGHRGRNLSAADRELQKLLERQ